MPLRTAPCSSGVARARPTVPLGPAAGGAPEHAARCRSCGVSDGFCESGRAVRYGHGSSELVKAHTPRSRPSCHNTAVLVQRAAGWQCTAGLVRGGAGGRVPLGAAAIGAAGRGSLPRPFATPAPPGRPSPADRTEPDSRCGAAAARPPPQGLRRRRRRVRQRRKARARRTVRRCHAHWPPRSREPRRRGCY